MGCGLRYADQGSRLRFAPGTSLSACYWYILAHLCYNRVRSETTQDDERFKEGHHAITISWDGPLY